MPKNDKKKLIDFTTPVGTAKYPHLNNPDTAFDAEGKYKSEILLSTADAKGLMDLINSSAKEAFGDAEFRVPFQKDEETGQVSFKAQSKYKPKFFDASGQVVPPASVPRIGGGSQLKLRGYLNVYMITKTNVGVSLVLQDVQIVEATTMTNGASAAFAAVEGGGFTVDLEEVTADVDNFDF
jgi:hypothetical protein